MATKTRKSKVILMDVTMNIGNTSKKKYRVMKLVNRLEPHLDDTLTETDVEHLMDNEPDCTVEVLPFKRKR